MIVGIIGCGAMGSEICRALSGDSFPGELLLLDRHLDRAQHLADISAAATAVASLQQIVDGSDLVVECASVQAVRDIALSVLKKGKDLMVLSVGALVDADFRQSIYEAARANKCCVYIPSGAIGALTHFLLHRREQSIG